MVTFIIGTDTNVGKTYIGTKLAKEGHLVIKPIETGKNTFLDINDSDSGKYALIQDLSIEDINLYFFNEPMSPHIASELDGLEIDIEKVKEFILHHNDCFAELAGGLMVPLNNDITQLDLIKMIPNSNVLLVVDNKLGAINHALLTIEVLKSHGIHIRDITYNDLNPETDQEIKASNIQIIEKLR